MVKALGFRITITTVKHGRYAVSNFALHAYFARFDFSEQNPRQMQTRDDHVNGIINKQNETPDVSDLE